ncbi:energy-coupling factor ABC transporter substrate-binding protein [Clostridium oceanicum]|uniref:Cobalt transport protein CbiN n=1 Tax=Clostridium oceanicum TaxID=1543 RepID=A0ABP3UMZ9_9CLOT
MKKQNIIISLICVIVITGCLVIGSIKGGEFSGTDDQAESAISELNKDYEPWFSHIWEPPSGEIESLLFSLQAALGAGVIGYYIGRKRNVKANKSTCKTK